ncbi:MAG: glycogen/starch synthase [Acidimicrobiales bacterium]
MHVLFATAELEPLVSTGGLGAAAAGLVGALRRDGITVTPVVPGYEAFPLAAERTVALDVPSWVGSASARVGTIEHLGQVVVIDAPSLARPHPYVDPESGSGWRDNDHRFFAWSAAVAALARVLRPDVVHVHDWHAATTLAHLPEGTPTVLTIHNLAHQGWCDPGWIDVLGARGERYRWKNSVNALAGGISLADRVVTVSPRYADEITTEEHGMGLDALLRSRGGDLVGILNGIDTVDWDPAADAHLVARYDASTVELKAANQQALCAELGLEETGGPLVVSVSRFDYQKGIDLLGEVAGIVAGVPARVALLGSGDRETEAAMARIAAAHAGRVAFRQGYDAALAHRMFAAGDLTVVPSRFEPCGLTQMQALRYGTIPIVTDVGGLHDTVVDADESSRQGTGIVMRSVSGAGIVDGVHRGVRLVSNRARVARVRARGMAADWSWDTPATHYRALYEGLVSRDESAPERPGAEGSRR